MRPLRLTFSGMRSYTGTCGPLDFTGKNLVGILGDTGAGKSTILEAITFALFGSSSWSGTAVAPLVSDGATAMSVDFTFAHGGQRWRVRRTFHADTTPTTHLLENLDTGEKYDNAAPVNRKIVVLLNLDLKSFQAAVLPPQGRFDELLKASGRERTALLKGIFGVPVIETMREQAAAHKERLGELLTAARVARASLLPDPEDAARSAEKAAEQAEARAAELGERFDRLRDMQRAAVRMRDRRERLAAALADLDRHRVGDTAAIISAVEPAERSLAAEAAELTRRHEAATARLTEATDRLDAAAADGETLGSLETAARVLSRVPARLTDLARQRAALRNDEKALADLQREADRADAERSAARKAAAAAAREAAAAEQRLAQTRAFVRRLRDHVTAAFAEAAAVARCRRDEQDARRALETRRSELPPLRSAVERARAAHAAAEERLTSVQRQEAAYLAGAHLSEGDDCPVCARPVPPGHRPPPALDPRTLAAARRDREAAQADLQKAVRAAERAEAAVEEAEKTARQRARATAQALDRLGAARAQVAAAARDVPWPQPDAAGRRAAHVPEWDAAAFAAAVDAAVETAAGAVAGAAGRGERGAAVDRAREAGDGAATGAATGAVSGAGNGAAAAAVLAPADAVERAMERGAEAARAADAAARTAVDTVENRCRELRRTQERETARVDASRRRIAEIEEHLRGDVEALPGVVAAALPDDPLEATEDDIAAARRVATDRHGRLSALERARDEARAALTEVAERRRAAQQHHQAQVAEPLRALLARLERWAAAVQEARRTGDGEAGATDATGAADEADTVDQRGAADETDALAAPADPDTRAVAAYAAGLERSAAAAGAALRAAWERATARTDELIDRLVAAAGGRAHVADSRRRTGSRAAAGDGPPDAAASGEAASGEGAPGGAGSAGVDPLDPAFLDALRDDIATARNEAERHRTEQREAERQIARARTLDEAIEAGEARHEAIERLRTSLAEAKFQQYLIDRRTRALLGMASDLFGELSDGEFGFAEDFQIVSRDSGVSRSPKTLSGGETFLASLALSLALVELYGRSGARLDALFLDEGFGSLDVDTLGRALSVLRSEMGGDKLVTVISHVHAVAEAVEDVLWVERPPTGSVARWLTAAERDALVREDVGAGLLGLA